MNQRKMLLNKIWKKANSIGPISEMVEQSLSDKKIPLEKKDLNFKAIGSVGPGTTVMISKNPVKNDDSVDFLFVIRGVAGGDVKTANQMGVNAVIVTAEAGGMGSKENQAAFGRASFINQAIAKILANLKQLYPGKALHRGKLGISSFSGGYAASREIVKQENQIPGGIDALVYIDGMHDKPGSPEMQTYVDWAKKAQQDPKKKMIVLHSAIKTNYSSTTDTSNYLVNQLGMERKKVNVWNGQGKAPATAAQSGGVSVLQLYDKPDPYMVGGKVNVAGSSGDQHIQSLHTGLNNLNQLLGESWN